MGSCANGRVDSSLHHGGRNFEVGGDRNNEGTTTKTVVNPAGSQVAVDASRLDPGVEEKVGY